MIIVTWRRTTTTGGIEWNYYYCDTMREAKQFQKDCEAVKGNCVEKISIYKDEEI